MDKIPKINQKAVCISCDKSADLAMEVSSYFRNSNEYFSVFNLLDLIESKKDAIDFSQDGFTELPVVLDELKELIET